MIHSSIRYTLARLFVFFACLFGFWLAGLKNPLLLLLVATTVSMFLSLFLLRGMRDRFSQDVARTIEQRRERRADRREAVAAGDEAAEDAEDEAGFVGDDTRRPR